MVTSGRCVTAVLGFDAGKWTFSIANHREPNEVTNVRPPPLFIPACLLNEEFVLNNDTPSWHRRGRHRLCVGGVQKSLVSLLFAAALCTFSSLSSFLLALLSSLELHTAVRFMQQPCFPPLDKMRFINFKSALYSLKSNSYRLSVDRLCRDVG